MKISEQEVSRLLFSSPFEAVDAPSSLHALEGRASRSEYATRANVTADSLEVQQIARLVKELPDMRAARVRALKAQVENGTYHVSGEDIADLIIRRLLADNTAI